jgi:hypothetical protein
MLKMVKFLPHFGKEKIVEDFFRKAQTRFLTLITFGRNQGFIVTKN